MNWSLILQMVIALVPAAVQAVEASADPNASGADKKAAALAAVTAAATAISAEFPGSAATVQLALKAAAPVIDAVVMTYNLIGKFIHKNQPAVAAAK